MPKKTPHRRNAMRVSRLLRIFLNNSVYSCRKDAITMVNLTNLTAIGILAALLTGCVDTTTDPAPSTPAYEFGSHYRLIENDATPRLQGDSLYVQLGYDCKPDSVIVLEHFKTGDSSYEIWLKRDEPGFACTMPIVDKRVFKLPAEVAGARVVRLLKPDSGSITLRN
jgi:hypothetical protein